MILVLRLSTVIGNSCYKPIKLFGPLATTLKLNKNSGISKQGTLWDNIILNDLSH